MKLNGAGSRIITLRSVTINSLENKVFSLFDGEFWAPDIQNHGLVFDLKDLEWFDTRALATLVIWIGNAVRSDIKVLIVISDIERIRTIASSSTDLQRMVRRQKLLRHSGFFSVLEIEGEKKPVKIVQAININPNYKELQETAEPIWKFNKEIDISKEPLPNHIFPMAWVSVGWTNSERIVEMFSRILEGHPDSNKFDRRAGMSKMDANVLANIILQEFVENVKDHSNTKQALIFAHVTGKLIKRNDENLWETELDYYNWRNKIDDNQVEIFVGDLGDGLVSTLRSSHTENVAKTNSKDEFSHSIKLNDSKVIQYAFGKWTTSRDRSDKYGTRGLYRLSRIAQKYNGLLTIRSGYGVASRDFGGPNYDGSPLPNEEGIPRFFPGTFCFFNAFTARSHEVIWRGETNLTPSSLPSEFRILEKSEPNDLIQQVKSEYSSTLGDIHLFIDAQLQLTDKEQNSSVLKGLSNIRHPSTLTITGLEGDWTAISSLIESVNDNLTQQKIIVSVDDQKMHPNSPATIEQEQIGDARKQFKNTQLLDPVLVIGEGHNEFDFLGVTPQAQKVFRRALQNENYKISTNDIMEFYTNEENRQEFEGELKQDSHLFFRHTDGSYTLRLNPRSIMDIVRGLIIKELQDKRHSSKDKIFRTPSLILTDSWYLNGLQENLSCGENYFRIALANFALSENLLAFDSLDDIGLFCDKSYSESFAQRLSQTVGLQKENGFRITDRSLNINLSKKNIRKGIIFVSLIRSGESSRQLIINLILSGIEPYAVVCIADTRPDTEFGKSFNVWGRNIRVYNFTPSYKFSYFNRGISEDKIINISPITGNKERKKTLDVSRLNNELSTKKLADNLGNCQALFFGHYGQQSGRHFTFYANARPVLDNPEIQNLIHESLKKAWLDIPELKELDDDKKSENIDIWFPADNTLASSPAEKLAMICGTSSIVHYGRMLNCNAPRSMNRVLSSGQWKFEGAETEFSKRAIICDWGTVTGSSLTNMIFAAAERGVDQVVALVLISQLPSHEEKLLKALSRIKVKRTTPKSGLFEEPTFKIHDVDVDVRFMAYLPIESFNDQNCPVCKTQRKMRRDQNFIRNVTDVQTVKDRISQYDIKERKTILDNGSAYSESSENYSNEMIGFRNSLLDASENTEQRAALLKELEALEKGLSTGNDEKYHQAAARIKFLSGESQWIDGALLRVIKIRKSIAKIAQYVFNDPRSQEIDQINALSVIRDYSKNEFIRNLGNNYDNSKFLSVRQILLFHLASYISRPYHQEIKNVSDIRHALSICQKSEKKLLAQENLIESIELLSYMAESSIARLTVEKEDKLDAWRNLKSALGNKYREGHWHYGVSGKGIIQVDVTEVRFNREAESLEKYGRFTKGYRKKAGKLYGGWKNFSRLLDHQIIPNLNKFRDDLIGPEGERIFSIPKYMRLVKAILDESTEKRSFLNTNFLHTVRHISENSNGFLNVSIWNSFYDEWEGIWKTLVNPGLDSERPAMLLKALDDCPASLFEAFEFVWEDGNEEASTIPKALRNKIKIEGIGSLKQLEKKVFCSSELLKDLFQELLYNCRNRSASEINISVSIILSEDESETTLKIVNSPIRMNQPGGGEGQKRLKQALKFYDAKILYPDRTQSRNNVGVNQYEVLVIFKNWRE